MFHLHRPREMENPLICHVYSVQVLQLEGALYKRPKSADVAELELSFTSFSCVSLTILPPM